MELDPVYNPAATEAKWYQYWIDKGFFHSEPDDRPKYSMIIPPPNVTGVLHMGHMLNNTIQDVLVRRARMEGKNTCWVPGTDHASIATEAKVVAKLKEEGIDKAQLTREEFMQHAWAWKEKHGGIILKQLRKLGASCDWERTKFTMDPALSRAVINTFVELYNQGMIYRGVRMVNWDPQGCTAVSDEEVIHREVKEKLYYMRYFIEEDGKPGGQYLPVATTRPETIMADVAVCVHPEDPRYRQYVGRKVYIPLIRRAVPVIADGYVTMDFGTGCLKITPAHDINDYEIGLRHNLPVIDILDEHGRLNANAQILIGEDRFAAREKVAEMLKEQGYLEKEEAYTTQVGFSERTNVVIEPRLSTQWFLRMETMAQRALEYIDTDKVRLIPDKYRNTYRHWMETAHDWCISRQLWWGQQIPAYYLPDGSYVVAATREEALALAREKVSDLRAEDLRQDEDVLDTWFSSWLWPISVFDPEKPGFPDKKPNAELAYYYPTNDLVTAPEILFFWVARMVMAGDRYCQDRPFDHVYLTGTVRDKLGRKMSKSLGNSPDPITLMERYGADGVRLGMLLCTAAGNDIIFDESQVEQGRNFCNKIWNAFRLIQGWEPEAGAQPEPAATAAVLWFQNLLNKRIAEMTDLFEKFRLSEALMLLYKLFWDDFCAYYLELIKPQGGKRIAREVYDATVGFMDSLLRLLHPYMPFITEELWQHLVSRCDGESIMMVSVPHAQAYDEALLRDFETAQGIIMSLRNLRQSKQISGKEALELYFNGRLDARIYPVICKAGNLSVLEQVSAQPQIPHLFSFMAGTDACYVPIGSFLNVEEERARIMADMDYYRKFLTTVEKKLANENFVSRAPEAVVALERKKAADATSKLEALEQQLRSL